MRQWAERFSIEGVGVDTNPAFLSTARRKGPGRGSLRFVESPVPRFTPEPHSYDVVLCLTSVSSIGGFVEAVDWMTTALKPGAAGSMPGSARGPTSCARSSPPGAGSPPRTRPASCTAT